jgi:hypothetical protein
MDGGLGMPNTARRTAYRSFTFMDGLAPGWNPAQLPGLSPTSGYA